MSQNQVAATETTEVATTATPEVTAAPAAKKAKAKKAAPAAKKAAAVKPVKEKTATVAVIRTETKKFKAIQIATAGIADKVARKDTLAKLQTELGLSASGANTYYQNVKTAKTGWTA